MTVSVFDITVCDWNIGNRIIMEAVYRELYELFPSETLISLPYCEPFSPMTLDYIQKSKHLFFGGGNVLASDVADLSLFWGIRKENLPQVNKTVLMGVGWWKYQHKPSREVSAMLQSSLHRHDQHSVRDTYTKDMLAVAGIANVLVTGCPSMWSLSPEFCRAIPEEKAGEVLCTFSADYAQDMTRDKKILQALARQYKMIYVWPQGPRDGAYVRQLGVPCHVLPANISALDRFLAEAGAVDYVGTRLHAGVKALQHGKRSLIVAIDNRAREQRRDFNFPVILDSELDELDDWIKARRPCEIRLPYEAINQWKSQYYGGGQWIARRQQERLSLFMSNVARANKRYAVYGTGKVAKEILSLVEYWHWPRPVFMIDHVPGSCDRLCGIPVRNLDTLSDHDFDAIVLGSNVHQQAMRAHLAQKFGDKVVPLDLSGESDGPCELRGGGVT